MGEILGQVLGDLLGSAEVLVFACGICQAKLTKDWKRWALSGALWLLVMAVGYGGVLDEMVAFPVKMIGKMMIVISLMQGKGIHKIIKYLFSVSYTAIIFEPIYFCIMLLRDLAINVPWEERMVRNLASGLNVCVLLLLARQIRKRSHWVHWIQDIPVKYYLLGIFCGFCANGLKNYMRWEIATLNFRSKLFWGSLTNIFYLLLYLLGISFAFIDLLRKQYFQESSLKSEYLKIAQEHFRELMEHTCEVRGIRHDMRAHMNALEYMLQKGSTEDAKAYLEEIKGEIDGANRKAVNVGNDLVNAVLEHELAKADADTTFQVEGCLVEPSFLSDYDLCVIFSNLLSNAVEACRQCSGKTEKRIFLDLRYNNGNLLIQMKNPMEGVVSLDRLGNYTSKKDTVHHGYGISNIRRTVAKYGGDLEFAAENGVFQAKIIFYLEQ